MTQFFFRDGVALSKTDNANVTIGKAGKSGYLTRREPCSRCGGQGGSPHWRPEGGVCFRCRGRKTEAVTRRVFTVERLSVLNIAAQCKADKEEARRSAKLVVRREEFITWAKPQGALIGAILTGKGNFFLDLASKLRSHWTLSEKQMDAAAWIIERNAERAVQDSTSAYVGDIKDRIEFEAMVEFTKEFDGFYGTSTVIKLRDLDGNVFTWFATGCHDVNRGDRVSIKGTVKKHEVYQGTKQTILSRCKITKFTILTADEAATTEEALA